MTVKRTTSVQNGQHEDKGYESVPTKTPNRSEYHAVSKTVSKHKSIIIQAPKADTHTDESATEKTYTTDSPSKHRKIIRSIQQSKSTKVLAPNNVHLDKQPLPKTNNMTILTEASEQKKNRDLVTQKGVSEKGQSQQHNIK